MLVLLCFLFCLIIITKIFPFDFTSPYPKLLIGALDVFLVLVWHSHLGIQWWGCWLVAVCSGFICAFFPKETKK